jgi:hypothetical protein
VIFRKKGVIDLTLGTNETGNPTSKWRLFDEPSLSDHRNICFQIGNIAITTFTSGDLNRTSWQSYEDDQKVNAETISRNIRQLLTSCNKP